MALPGLRDHHQHRVGQAASAQVQQFEHLVEARGVRGTRGTDREQLFDIGRRPKDVGLDQRLAGRIQFSLPVTVLISPLCAIRRNGCASGQDGKVFVENRECTMPSALVSRSSCKSR